MLAQDSVGDVCRLDRRETASGMDAAWLTRFGATAFISRRRKQQHRGWQPLGWPRQEAMYPWTLIPSKQEAISVAVVLYFLKVARCFRSWQQLIQARLLLCQAGSKDAQ